MTTPEILHLEPVSPGDCVLIVTADGRMKRGPQCRAAKVRRIVLSLGGTIRIEPVADGFFRPGSTFDRRACIALASLDNLP